MRQVHSAQGALDDEAIQRYREDGAVIVRGLLGREIIEQVASSVCERLDLLEQLHDLPRPAPSGDAVADASARLVALHRAVPALQGALYDALSNAPALHRVAAGEALLSQVQALLSPTLSIHQRLILLMSLPEERWHLAQWHQDWYYNEGPHSTVTVYAPLQKTTGENGSLLLALGEHRVGLLPHADHASGTKWHTIDPAAVERFANVAPTEFEAGDVLFFNSLVPHSPRVNQSGHVRFVLNFRYRDLTESEFLQANWRIGEIGHARQALARKQ